MSDEQTVVAEEGQITDTAQDELTPQPQPTSEEPIVPDAIPVVMLGEPTLVVPKTPTPVAPLAWYERLRGVHFLVAGLLVLFGLAIVTEHADPPRQVPVSAPIATLTPTASASATLVPTLTIVPLHVGTTSAATRSAR